MQSRLMEAALVVLGRKGVEASIIDDITRLAGTSRGTFYNYFRTNEEVLRSVAVEVANELMAAVAPVVESFDNPVERMAAGVRLWLTLVDEQPHLPSFFRRAGLYVLEQNTRVREDMPRDLMMGMSTGQFTVPELELGFVVVAGTVLAAINTLALGNAPPGYPQDVAERILLGLGVPRTEAKRSSHLTLPRVQFPPQSLVVRSAVLSSSNPNRD